MGISQEVRTHMNAVVGFSYLLEEIYSGQGDGKIYSNQILNSCKKLIWLFESFLEVSADDNYNSTLNVKKCRLNNFLDSIISELRELMLQCINNDRVILNGNHYSDLSEICIDTTKVHLAISCLIHNAINNSEAGPVKVGYNLYYGKVTFYVLDTGQDYSKCLEFLHNDDMDSSLTKFYDVSSAINVMLAKKIVKIMGGTLWFEHHDLSGTGAFFSIPIKATENANISTANCSKSIAI